MKLKNLFFSFIIITSPVFFALPNGDAKNFQPASTNETYNSEVNLQFINDRILGEIEKKQNEGWGLTLTSWAATLPSIFCTGEAFKLFAGAHTERGCNFGIGAIASLSLPLIVNLVGQSYKTEAAQMTVIKEIATNLETYKQYLPETLIPLFAKAKEASDKELKRMIPDMLKLLDAEAASSNKTSKVWKFVKSGTKKTVLGVTSIVIYMLLMIGEIYTTNYFDIDFKGE